jgi:hypothetical protein
LKAHGLPHFEPIGMADFVDPHKVVAKKVHFQPFQVHKIKVTPKKFKNRANFIFKIKD